MASEFPSGEKPRTAMGNAFEEAEKKSGNEIKTATPESDAILSRIVSEEAAAIGQKGLPEAAPEPAISPEAARLEAKEQQAIDENIPDRPAGPAEPKPATEEDWIKLEMRMGGENLDLDLSKGAPAKLDLDMSAPEPKSAPDRIEKTPPELQAIFGEAVPSEALEMYGKLGGKKRESYIAHLKERKAEQDAKSARFQRERSRRSLRTVAAIDRMRNEGGVAPDLERPSAEERDAASSARPEKGPKKPRAKKKVAKTKESEPAPPVQKSAPESADSKIEDKSGGYVEKYSELRMLAKQHHPTGMPEDLAAKIADLDKRYLLNVRTGRDPETQSKLIAELDALTTEVKLPRPSRDLPERPVTIIESSGPEREDATRAEEKKKLAYVVGKLVGKTVRKGIDAVSGSKEGAKDSAERNNLGEKLKQRSAELDKEAAKMGKVEGLFRTLGEKYGKLGWKSKLAIGAGLGLGAGISAAALSLPATLFFMSGIAAQRTAGFSSMFLKFEKSFQDKKWDAETKKWAALGSAGAYTAAMATGMAYLVKGVAEAAESDWAHDKLHGIAEWMHEHNPLASHKAHSPQMPGTTFSPEATGTAHAPVTPVPEAAPAAVPEAVQSELPSVEASPGHGYEYMAKRLWEQLSEKHLDPNSFPEGSDIRQLLQADNRSIDSVVHRLALSHEFVKPDGTSTLIGEHAHMTFGADGELHLDSSVQAPEGAPVTPAFHPEAPAAPEAVAEPGAMDHDGYVAAWQDMHPGQPYPGDAAVDAEIDQYESGELVAPPPEVPPPPAEIPVQETPATEAAPSVEAPASEMPHVEAPAPAAPEMLYAAGDHAPIDPTVPAIYEAHDPATGASYLAAYGGTDAERFSFIQDYLAKPEHQGQTIRWAHEMPSITGSSTKVEEIGANAQNGSWLLKFFTQQPSPPSPDTFLRKVTP